MIQANTFKPPEEEKKRPPVTMPGFNPAEQTTEPSGTEAMESNEPSHGGPGFSGQGLNGPGVGGLSREET